MRVLIAITSCKRDAVEELNQAQRDTFLKNITKFPGLEYRFFIGDGFPAGDEPLYWDDFTLRKSVIGCVDPDRGIDYKVKCDESEKSVVIPYPYPKRDEIMLPVADDYMHLPYKVRALHRWAATQDFDYIYKCDTDTYVNLERLMNSGFEEYDLSGGQTQAPGNIAGGGGYWLSRKASQLLLDAPIKYWAEDGWVTDVMNQHEIFLHVDSRYSDLPIRKDNDLISTHLGFKPGYHPKMMYDLHNFWEKSPNTPKVLIAISSWVTGALNGDNQAMRDTFLKDISKYPGLDYKFFIGDGTPVTTEEDSALLDTLENKFKCPGHKEKAMSTKDPIGSFTYVPKDDEIILHVPDGYLYMSHKTRESHRWALENGFDYIFQCFPDTFINLERLMGSGFEAKDYVGTRIGSDLLGWYASGGCGYWLSKKATQFIVDAVINDWAEDRWVGDVLRANEIYLHHDRRYTGLPNEIPHSRNDYITSHLCDTPKIYDNKIMYECYRLFSSPVAVAKAIAIVKQDVVKQAISKQQIVQRHNLIARPNFVRSHYRQDILDRRRIK